MLYERLFLGRQNIYMHLLSQNEKWQKQVQMPLIYLVDPMSFIGDTQRTMGKEVLKGTRGTQIVAIRKLKPSMEYSFWTLDTWSTLYTCRHIYRLKGILFWWFSLSKPLLNSRVIWVSSWELTRVNPVSFWDFLSYLGVFIFCLNHFPSGWNISVSRKWLHNSIFFRLFHFVFIMKYLRLKK